MVSHAQPLLVIIIIIIIIIVTIGSHDIDELYYMHQQFKFCKYWSDDGPFWTKLVANI